jgi:hypothetical protein
MDEAVAQTFKFLQKYACLEYRLNAQPRKPWRSGRLQAALVVGRPDLAKAQFHKCK